MPGKTLHGTPHADHLEGTRFADRLYGEGGSDILQGHRSNDILDGGAGNDRLGGGEGHDRLTGGAGSDAFVFHSFAAADSDVITDFRHGVDSLQLDSTVFHTLHRGHVPAADFYVGVKAHDANDHFIYNRATGRLYYDDDGNGAHAQHLVATFTNHAALSAHDLLMI